MDRIDTYARDLRRNFRWDRIREEAREEVYCFLGSTFSLAPSGKFYTPWASSNVAGCRRCKGTGEVKNRKADPALFAAADARNAELLADLLANHGAKFANEWPEDKQAALEASRNLADANKPTRTCEWCRGSGSHEAAKDVDWFTALARVAEEHGLFVGGPDGADGCDVFVGDADALDRLEEGEDEE